MDFQQRLRVLRLLCQDVLQLQKGRQKATRLQLELEQHQKQEMEQKIQQAKQRATAPICAALWLNTLAESFGGGEAGEQAAAHILEVQNGRAPGTLNHGDKSGTVKPSQTESNHLMNRSCIRIQRFPTGSSPWRRTVPFQFRRSISWAAPSNRV